MVEHDEILLNFINLIPVASAQFPQVHYRETVKFFNWLQSREAQIVIRNFEKDEYGEPPSFSIPLKARNYDYAINRHHRKPRIPSIEIRDDRLILPRYYLHPRG